MYIFFTSYQTNKNADRDIFSDRLIPFFYLIDIEMRKVTYLIFQLSFSKDDIIIITQAPTDGGWWEGTLDGKTGWFPSNYVEQILQKTGN